MRLYIGAMLYIVINWLRQHGWLIACIAGMVSMIMIAVTDVMIFKDGSLVVYVVACGLITGYTGYKKECKKWNKKN